MSAPSQALLTRQRCASCPSGQARCNAPSAVDAPSIDALLQKGNQQHTGNAGELAEWHHMMAGQV